jgi:hypothetical protein
MPALTAAATFASSSSNERQVLDTSDPATWARPWSIEKAIKAKDAAGYSDWLSATFAADALGHVIRTYI